MRKPSGTSYWVNSENHNLEKELGSFFFSKVVPMIWRDDLVNLRKDTLAHKSMKDE